jgi:hypothetical protein
MNEHDIVCVKETVIATPDFDDEPIEIKAGWRGTIIAHAEKPTPCIEFAEEYRGQPFLVDMDAVNLEVVGNQDERTRLGPSKTDGNGNTHNR